MYLIIIIITLLEWHLESQSQTDFRTLEFIYFAEPCTSAPLSF